MRRFQPRRGVISFAVGAAFAATSPSLLANPSGGVVAHGTASFASSGNTLTVTNSPGAIINWQQFSIGRDEVTRFIQQHAASAVLNRVVSQNPSTILGTLQSNGRVFLINPSGIAFGAGAVIDVAGFAASTLNMSDADWISGRMRFAGAGNEGKITNAGTIRTAEGGHVYLVAPNVENQASGVITSPKGEVVIAAGKTVELVNAQTPDIRVEFTAPANEAVNAGQIVASSGRIGVYGTLIKNSGLVSATGVAVEGGKIVLKAVKDITLDATSRIEASGTQGGAVKVQAETGTLLAQGVVEAKGGEQTGGEIQLLGNQVGLIGTVTVDASGERGGGTVLVGGDYQGKNVDIQNAQRTFVGADAVIRADAGNEGDGGKVIVWADGDTRFYGNISARGGADSGNGGLVETSGKQALDFKGAVDTSAANGAFGTLLLDPTDIQINGTDTVIPDTTGITNTAPTPNVFQDSAVLATSEILASTLATQLGSNNVTIKTSNASGTALLGGTVTFNASVTKAASGGTTTLRVEAEQDIIVAGGVSISATDAPNKLNVEFVANSDSTGSGGIRIGDGATTATIDTKGGDIALGGSGTNRAIGASGTSNVGVWLDKASLTSAGGAITIRGQGAAVNDGHGVLITNATQISSGAGNIVVDGLAGASSGNNIGVFYNQNTGGGIFAAGGAINITGAGANDGAGSDAGALLAGLIETSGAGAITINTSVGNVGGAGKTGDALTIYGTIRSTASGGDIVINGTGGTSASSAQVTGVQIGATSAAQPGVIESLGAGNITITGTGGTTVGGAHAHGVILTSDSGFGPARITSSGTGNITINGTGGTGTSTAHGLALGTFGATVESTGSGNIAVNASAPAGVGIASIGSGPYRIGSATMTGSITLTADTIDIATNTSVVGTGALTLQANAAATTVGIGTGGTGTFNLSSAEIGNLADGFSSITIGRSDGTGLVTIGAATFNDPVTIRAGGATGDITVSGALATVGNSGIALDAGRDIAVNAGISGGTNGNLDLLAKGVLTLNANVTATGTGTVTLTGDADGNATAGTAVLNQVAGTVSAQGGAILAKTGAASAGDILVGAITNTTANGAGALTVRSEAGSVLQNAGGTDLLTSPGTISLLAGNTTAGATSVGTSTDAINTAGGTLTAKSGTGGIYIDEADGATIGTIASAGNVAITSATGNLTASAAISTTAGGTVDLTATAGTLILQGTSSINADGAVTLTGGSGISTAANVTTTDDTITFASGTTLTGDVVLSTGATGAGNVAFDSFLTATNAGLDDITITAGTGNVTFTGTVGGTRLGHVLVNSAADVSANAITATSLRQVAGTGTTTLNGAVNVNGTVPTTTSGVVIANNVISTTGTSSITTGGASLFFAGDDMTLGGAAASINTGGGAVTLTSQSAAQSITLGAAGGLSLVTNELDTFTNAPTITVGTNATFLSTAAHTGAISVGGATTVNTVGLTGFNIINAGTGGADSVSFSGTLTSPKPVSVSTAAGNIKFNAAGKILANGAAAADRTVNLTATTGRIDGNATSVTNYIAGTPASNVQADRLNAVGAGGIGVTNGLVTEIIDLQASTTNADINVYNVGALNIAGTGINAGIDAAGGNLTLAATGAITQSAPLLTDALQVVTLNSPGANITLTNVGNDAQSYGLFACLAVPGGCPSDNPVLSTNGTRFGNGTNAGYAAGSIQYRDSNGANLSGIGTISAFSTFTAGDTTVTANSISASDITLEASGNITVNLGSSLLKINNAGTGSFNLIAGGNITMVGASGTIGTAGSTFNHALNLTAGGNIVLENSIFQGAKNLTLAADASIATGNQTVASNGIGNVTMQGNYTVQTGGDVTVTGRDFTVQGGTSGGTNQNGQELTVSGTLNLLNTGVISILGGTSTGSGNAGDGAGNSAGGARVTATTVNIGSSGGTNPTRLIIKGGTNTLGYQTTDSSDPLRELRQADARLKATGDMKIYLSSSPSNATPVDADGNAITSGGPYSLVIAGGSASATATGTGTRTVTALGALQAKNLELNAEGSILLQGGTSTVNSSSALSETSAVVLIEGTKLVKTTNGGWLVVKGGRSINNTASTTNAQNARSRALFDPSKLTAEIAGSLVLESGLGSTGSFTATSARIDAGDEIKITVLGPSTSYTYRLADGSTRTLNGSVFMIGGASSGFFDSQNTPLGSDTTLPGVFPITVTALGGFAKAFDTNRGDAVVQTGLATFNESLLSYIIFAANEETRAARIRRGLSDTDDLGAPACK